MKLSPVVRTLAGVIAVAALVAGAIPAQAGSLSWADPKGDAVGLGVADGPQHDPNFDITAVSLESVGGKFTWTVKIPELAAGRPTLSTGYGFRFYFSHAAAPYYFQVGEDATGAQTFVLSTATTPAVSLVCKDCKGKIDRKDKTVVVEAPLASLDKAFTDAKLPAASGAEFSALDVWAQRRVGVPVNPGSGLVLVADKATAPEGSVFAL